MEETQIGTSFFRIYCRFLDKITDDLFLELSLEETLSIIDSLFLDSLQEFTYPRFRIGRYDTTIITSDALDEEGNPIVTGAFFDTLTNEEENILAEIMLLQWYRRQLANTRIIQMRYSTSDFKQTSQAAHMQRLDSVITNHKKYLKHLQNNYSKRKVDEDGFIIPDFDNLSGVGHRRIRHRIHTPLGVVRDYD